MRAFIAIELDNPTRSILCDCQDRLKTAGVRGNYTRAENLHITIKFLGEINAAVFRQVQMILEKTALRHKSFVLTLNNIGKFDKRNKKILWAGIKRSDDLLAVYHTIDSELEKILPGLTEMSYSPHITLVREAMLPPDLQISSIKTMEHPFTVGGLSLMESTRIDGRLTYIRRAFANFDRR